MAVAPQPQICLDERLTVLANNLSTLDCLTSEKAFKTTRTAVTKYFVKANFSRLPCESLQKWQNKSPGRDEGGKQNGNLWFCGIFSNAGSRPGPFFPSLGFTWVWENVSHVSTLSCPFCRALSGFWLRLMATLVWDGPGPGFTSAGAEASQLSRGSLTTDKLH